MKKFNLLILTLLVSLMPLASQAQNNIKFEIRHWLGDEAFAFDSPSKNSLDNDFTVTRLQYYVSRIAITHDTGKVTNISDFWILVDAGTQTLVDLGDHNIDQIEAISFHVGVEQAYNHLDPSQYPSTHPLAPKAPSMHWGWASGYRFLAMEGNSGSGLTSNYQLHALGNINYFTTEIADPHITPFANGRVISLDADYAEALNSIDVSGGVIVHGDYGAAQMALYNFKNYVFTPASSSTAIPDDFADFAFSLYPNPAVSGNSRIKLAEPAKSRYEVSVVDMLGKVVYQGEIKAGKLETSVSIELPGFYLVSLRDGNKLLNTNKLIVK